MVEQFQNIFKIVNNYSPTNIGKKAYTLRYDLGLEELNEYKEACEANDLVEVADSLGDQLYILLGTILRHGMQDIIHDVFQEIHDSNLSKLENGSPLIREDGKIMKGKSFFPPNIKRLIVN